MDSQQQDEAEQRAISIAAFKRRMVQYGERVLAERQQSSSPEKTPSTKPNTDSAS